MKQNSTLPSFYDIRIWNAFWGSDERAPSAQEKCWHKKINTLIWFHCMKKSLDERKGKADRAYLDATTLFKALHDANV